MGVWDRTSHTWEYEQNITTQVQIPASFPLAIMLVATNLMVDCEGPEEVMVVTKQALSESQ